MARLSKRPMSTMFQGAMSSQRDDEIAQLKAELEMLRSQSTSASTQLPTQQIVPLRLPENLKQPRRYFALDKMAKLKASIDKHEGVLEPILVRTAEDGLYEIISGERRWRCCCELGIETIPAMTVEMSDEMALEVALIAHLLSEEISPIEETDSIMGLLMLRLKKSFEEVKRLVGQIKNYHSGMIGSVDEEEMQVAEAILEEFDLKVGSFVSNRLPLLNLAPVILEAVRAGKLSPTNATLINRQPENLHEQLVQQSEGLTKEELMKLLSQIHRSSSARSALSESSERGRLGTSGDSQPESLNQNLSEEPVYERVYTQIKMLRRKKQLFKNKQVQSRISKIDKLLDEIASIAEDLGIEV
ncbi:ParB/RepB/Spo0J family partition protein [Pseudanabaena sp. FACHB-2040]|uniref:ParB/RepB/Spo0J family partition protein n=1 Tax=Pseudanabaena sp. FACHB-2040 TaxID=2692859 RepID=UPI001686E18F|nr:ParB/RepB/Spo0J family partition protein [Pseudanabaena sp. FACHB-2040]MBD2258327.1 ParB/RepB/Spo0J family partition protein [Pseudanabaena sp. FACHB-2040]